MASRELCDPERTAAQVHELFRAASEYHRYPCPKCRSRETEGTVIGEPPATMLLCWNCSECTPVTQLR